MMMGKTIFFYVGVDFPSPAGVDFSRSKINTNMKQRKSCCGLREYIARQRLGASITAHKFKVSG
jgi:hypothetical protein